MTNLLAVLIAVLTFGCAKIESDSPLHGYWVMMGNGITPIDGVMRDGYGNCPIANWVCITSDVSPKIITSYLKPAKLDTAAPGQVWVNSSAIYVNTPESYVWPRSKDASFSQVWATNNWPMLNSHTELIYVLAIEKATGGEVKGTDYYAHCRVRMWSGTTAYVESDSTLILSYLTNNATLLKWPKK